jgi:hypothetical protein
MIEMHAIEMHACSNAEHFFPLALVCQLVYMYVVAMTRDAVRPGADTYEA